MPSGYVIAKVDEETPSCNTKSTKDKKKYDETGTWGIKSVFPHWSFDPLFLCFNSYCFYFDKAILR